MADTAAPQAPAAPPAAPESGDGEQPRGLDIGRIIDAAGIGAAIILVVIVADIWSDGRLISRRLMARRRGQDNGQDGVQVEPAAGN